MLGHPPHGLDGVPYGALMPPDERAAGDSVDAELRGGRHPRPSVERRYVRRDGSVFWGNLTVAPVVDADGAVEHLVAMIEDVDDRKPGERAQAPRRPRPTHGTPQTQSLQRPPRPVDPRRLAPQGPPGASADGPRPLQAGRRLARPRRRRRDAPPAGRRPAEQPSRLRHTVARRGGDGLPWCWATTPRRRPSPSPWVASSEPSASASASRSSRRTARTRPAWSRGRTPPCTAPSGPGPASRWPTVR